MFCVDVVLLEDHHQPSSIIHIQRSQKTHGVRGVEYLIAENLRSHDGTRSGTSTTNTCTVGIVIVFENFRY